MKTGVWVSSPYWERSRSSASTEDGESKNEHHDLSSTIESSGNNVVVLDEKLWALLSEIPLSKEPKEEEDTDSRVDTNEQVTHLPEDDGEIDVAEERVGEVAIEEPEGDGNDEAENIGDCDPLVLRADGEGVLCDGPGDGEGVELLDVLTRPNVGANETLEDRSLVVDDAGEKSVLRFLRWKRRSTYVIIITQFMIAPTIQPITWIVKVCLGDKWTYCASFRSRASN